MFQHLGILLSLKLAITKIFTLPTFSYFKVIPWSVGQPLSTFFEFNKKVSIGFYGRSQYKAAFVKTLVLLNKLLQCWEY